MKMGKILLISCLLITSFLNGMPNHLKNEIREVQSYFSALSLDLSRDKIDDVLQKLGKTYTKIQTTYKSIDIAIDPSYDDVPKYMRILKNNMNFLSALKSYMNGDKSLGEELIKWENACDTYAPIVEKALSN